MWDHVLSNEKMSKIDENGYSSFFLGVILGMSYFIKMELKGKNIVIMNKIICYNKK